MTLESFEIHCETQIAAPRDVVFAALTTFIGRWWNVRTLAQKYAMMLLEPHVGGRFFEDAGEGTGALWGTVIDFVPPRLLRLSGPLDLRTPAIGVFEYQIEEDGKGSLVKLSHCCAGLFGPDLRERQTETWANLLEALKHYAETPQRI